MQSENQRTDSLRTPRNHRGRRSGLTLASRLEPWARDLWIDFRQITSPKRLRQVLNCLRSLVSLLEEVLATLEAQEAERSALDP
jgi:hypothetical protein